MARVARRFVVCVLVALLIAAAFPLAGRAADISTSVAGTANIFGAGHPTAPAPGGGGAGALPPGFALPPGTGRIVTFNNVTGIFHSNASTNIGPDGNGSPSGLFVNSVNGISGVRHDTVFGYLTGVFLTSSEPANPAPLGLDFTDGSGTGIGRNFTTLSPAVNQTFFIGDGLTGTGTGAVQQFLVPDAATRLYIGFADSPLPPGGDAGAYSDNSGGYNVTISGVVPEPSTALIALGGLSILGLLRRRSRRRAAATFLACALIAFATLFSAPAARATTYADSQADFSGVQGQGGWSYGYYGAAPYNQSSFQQMTHYQFLAPNGNIWAVDTNNYWTGLWANGGHPNVGGFSGKNPALQDSVRRWVSTVSGPVTISGNTADQDAAGPDGVITSITVDGTQVFTRTVPNAATTALAYSINTSLNIASIVDFVIAPATNNDGADSTLFTAAITSPIPEPSGIALILIGVAALALSRRSRRGKFAPAACVVALLACVICSPAAHAALTLTAASAAQGMTLTTFATAFPTGASGNNTGTVGPIGIAFPSSGGVLVSDYPGNVRLFASDTDGQTASAGVIGQNYAQGNALGLTRLGTAIYMARQPNNDVVQINSNGTFNQSIVTSVSFATDVVANPNTGHLFVSARGTNQILDVDPIAKTKSAFVTLQADGLALSADGGTLYAADPTNTGHVFGFNTTTKAQVFDSGFISGDPAGVALGTGTLTGKLIVSTYLSGEVLAVDLATLSQTVIANGGSRSEHIALDPANNTLLITQSDSIVRLASPVPEPIGMLPCFIAAAALLRRPCRRH